MKCSRNIYIYIYIALCHTVDSISITIVMNERINVKNDINYLVGLSL